jgi:solute carrier family 13 (sodium-dependent dicarboxylate transporter), member 2/3/5
VNTSDNHIRQVGLFAGPLLFVGLLLLIPEGFISTHAPLVLALLAWMVCWWITEAVPVAIASLLPLVLFPAFGVMSMTEASTPYANSSIFLFMGGFMIALALEKHNLHERIALSLIKFTGTSGNGIILGFTLATGFLSMWISNTATTLMMLPIAISVINLLHANRAQRQANQKQERYFALGLMLSIGYMASIGGIATIIGTPPNTVFVGFVKEFYNHDIAFGKWLLIGLPVSVLLGVTCYFVITRVLFPNKLGEIPGSNELIKNKLERLGRLGIGEKRVLFVFGITCLAWILQLPINNFFEKEVLNDTNVAIAGGILMFVIPSNFSKGEFLLSWDDTRKLPWGILILFGGGICLAKGMENTGIIKLMGDYVSAVSSVNQWLLLLSIITLTVLLTEVMGNIALVTIFIPAVFAIAEGTGVNPIVLALPVTFAASSGFMFPISTPPNAIVFASGHIRMKEMIRAGLLLDIASILIIYLLSWAFLESINI